MGLFGDTCYIWPNNRLSSERALVLLYDELVIYMQGPAAVQRGQRSIGKSSRSTTAQIQQMSKLNARKNPEEIDADTLANTLKMNDVIVRIDAVNDHTRLAEEGGIGDEK